MSNKFCLYECAKGINNEYSAAHEFSSNLEFLVIICIIYHKFNKNQVIFASNIAHMI